jgi:hypothetical protein
MSNGNLTNKDLGIVSEQHSRDIISIREYFEALLKEQQARVNERFEIQEKAVQTALLGQEKAVSAAIIAADRAVTKAETATEKRFESVNEFRSTLADQASMLMPKSEAEIRFKSVEIKFDDLSKQLTDLRSRVDVGPAGLRALQTISDINSGVKQGSDENYTRIALIIATTAAIVAVAVRFIK